MSVLSYPVSVHLSVFQLALDALTSFLGGGDLLVRRFDLFLHFLHAGLEFAPGFLQFFGLGQAFAFVFGAPLLYFGVGLGQETLEFALAFLLFFEVITQGVSFVLIVAELRR